MKILHLTRILCLMAVVCFYSCSKTGPAGPQGEQGPKGDPGTQGIPGADGSTIYSGNGAPSADLGKEGDYYLDKSSSGLYGPKTDKGWGNPLDLKGEKGDKGEQGDPGKNGKDGKDGQAGSQILSGNSKPASSIGNTGDYYWDVSTYTLYGPKTAAGWGSGVMLRGPKGDKGDKGDPGNANVISSGWIITWHIWDNKTTGMGVTFSEPGDLDVAVYYDYPFTINKNNANAAILAYVDDGAGIHFVPFQAEIKYNSDYLGSVKSELAFRYVIAKPQSESDENFYIIPVVALRKGEWDLITPFGTQSYMQAHYLPSLKWKIVVIPANANDRKSSPPPNPKDYKATCAYYGISE